MMTNFIEEFRLLKNNYEKKEKGDNEANTYELLKKLICKYGYDSVCNEISFYNEKNESKNKELSFIISEVKKKVSNELLCSMLFYLDDSDILSQKNNLNFEQIKNKDKINSKINLSHNGTKGSTCKFKVLKGKKEIKLGV